MREDSLEGLGKARQDGNENDSEHRRRDCMVQTEPFILIKRPGAPAAYLRETESGGGGGGDLMIWPYRVFLLSLQNRFDCWIRPSDPFVIVQDGI